MELKELEQIVSKHLLLHDVGIIKLLCAVVIANKIDEVPPVWLVLISSSAGGKSSLLQSLEGISGTHAIDDLTANTFASAQVGKDGKSNALLDEMSPGSIVIIKDFTVIMDKEKESRNQVIGQLRKIFDQDYSRKTGNGHNVKWSGKMGLIAGCTTIMYTMSKKYASMGERFIFYFMEQPDREIVTMRAITRMKDKTARKEMMDAFTEFISQYTNVNEPITFDQETYTNVVLLSEMASRARSSVERDEYSRDKVIIAKHAQEMPMRLAKQLTSIGYGLWIINGGGLKLEDQKILYKIALDSIPMQRKEVLVALTKFAQARSDALGVELNLPGSTVMRELEDLNAVGMVDKVIDPVTRKINWTLKGNYRNLISKFENIEIGESNLVTDDPPPEGQALTDWENIGRLYEG